MHLNMDQKKTGIVIMLFGLVLGASIFAIKIRETQMIDKIVDEQGSCFLSDGTCLHQDMDNPFYILGIGFSLALSIFGAYIAFFDKTQDELARHQKIVSGALAEASRKDEFKAYLAGFDENEQNVIAAVHEQDGIKQSTLRYRTGMSKTSLSLMLKNLEERGIISRKDSGKTKEIYLRKRF